MEKVAKGQVTVRPSFEQHGGTTYDLSIDEVLCNFQRSALEKKKEEVKNGDIVLYDMSTKRTTKKQQYGVGIVTQCSTPKFRVKKADGSTEQYSNGDLIFLPNEGHLGRLLLRSPHPLLALRSVTENVKKLRAYFGQIISGLKTSRGRGVLPFAFVQPREILDDPQFQQALKNLGEGKKDSYRFANSISIYENDPATLAARLASRGAPLVLYQPKQHPGLVKIYVINHRAEPAKILQTLAEKDNIRSFPKGRYNTKGEKKKTGRKSLHELYPQLRSVILEYLTLTGVAIDDSLVKDLYFKGWLFTVKGLAEYVEERLNFLPSESSLRRHFQARNPNSYEAARRHEYAFEMKLRVPSRIGYADFRLDYSYCTKQYGLLTGIAAILGDDAICVAKDDKARLFSTGEPRRPLRVAGSRDTSHHEYVQQSNRSITLSTTAKILYTETAPSTLPTRQLQVSFLAKSTPHTPSNAQHHADAFCFELEQGLLTTTKCLPKIVIQIVDGGADRSFKNFLPRFYTVLLQRLFHFDTMISFKFEPNGSKRNPAESPHVLVSRLASKVHFMVICRAR